MANGLVGRLVSGGLETVPRILGYLALFLLAVFFARLYQNRMLFRRIQKDYGIVRHLPPGGIISKGHRTPRESPIA